MIKSFPGGGSWAWWGKHRIPKRILPVLGGDFHEPIPQMRLVKACGQLRFPTGPLGSLFLPPRRCLVVDKVVLSDGKIHSWGCVWGYLFRGWGRLVSRANIPLSHQPTEQELRQRRVTTPAQLRDSQVRTEDPPHSPPHPTPNLASQANFYSSFKAFWKDSPTTPGP